MKPVSPLPSRYAAIDVARVLAIIFMIQGHTLDVLLAPASRQGFAFDMWLFLRGLTAPTFFVLSGVSFAVVSLRRWESYAHLSSACFRRLGRFAFFILLGYAMHLPVRTFPDLRWLDAAGWQNGLQVDVLQCIGFTLAFLQILVLVAKTPTRFCKAVLGAAALVVLLTPIVWGISWSKYLPLSVASYLSGNTGSLFPLFPWAGYVLFGAAAGYFCVQRQPGPGLLPVRLLTTGGLALFLTGVLLQEFPFRIYSDLEFWRTSPNLFSIRVGCVGLLLAAIAYFAQSVQLPERGLRAIAAESLLIYFVHISILYGSLWNAGLRQSIGSTLTIVPTLGWVGLMLISMMLLAWTWNWFKRAEPQRSFVFRTAIALVAIYSLT